MSNELFPPIIHSITPDLKVGDVLVKGLGSECWEVTAMEKVPDSVLYKVSAIRRYEQKGKKQEGKSFFYAGREAVHQLDGSVT